MQVVPVEEPQKYGEVVGVVTEQPAPASGVVVGVLTEQPGASEGLGGRGSLEFLGRWNRNRAMPTKLKAERDTETMVRVGFGKLVDELVQNGASSGILAISCWSEMRSGDRGSYEVTVWGFSWSASPDDVSYQRHGFVGMQSDQRQIRFADFEGVVDDWGEINQNMAVYRVTLPRGGLDADKWAGRPPPPAPEDLYTGPRSDGLLSTEGISGDYRCCCFPIGCDWMTVVPLGADVIETWRTGCVFFPPFFIAPTAQGALRTRKPGTNAFLNPQPPIDLMTFSADGTAEHSDGCCCYEKRRTSQKRAFQKVDARDLAGKWCGCLCIPFVAFWPLCVLSPICCTRRKALNQDQYEESGLCWFLGLPIPVSETRTRKYVNGHPTNGFDGYCYCVREHTHWHRDPGCAGGGTPPFDCVLFKKVG
jgi:hypothetical protein